MEMTEQYAGASDQSGTDLCSGMCILLCPKTGVLGARSGRCNLPATNTWYHDNPCSLFGFIFRKSIDSEWLFILSFSPIQENSFYQIFPSEGSQNVVVISFLWKSR